MLFLLLVYQNFKKNVSYWSGHKKESIEKEKLKITGEK